MELIEPLPFCPQQYLQRMEAGELFPAVRWARLKARNDVHEETVNAFKAGFLMRMLYPAARAANVEKYFDYKAI